MKEIRIYGYTGNYQTVNLLPAEYIMECWGARGSQSRTNNSLTGRPGYGGYTYGELPLPDGKNSFCM